MNTILEELESLAEPTVGRSLPACGFIFADSFDVLLRNLTEEYFEAAWQHLSMTLASHRIAVKDLSWGWLHPGQSGRRYNAPFSARVYTGAPSDYTGWTSCELSELWRTPQLAEIDLDLLQGSPSLRCDCTWRSRKWRIAPQDYAAATKLISDLWVGEPTDWNPELILREDPENAGLWGEIAHAILQKNQSLVDALMERARAEYSPTGYDIVMRGFASYITGWNLPDETIDRLLLTMRGTNGHSNIYPDENLI